MSCCSSLGEVSECGATVEAPRRETCKARPRKKERLRAVRPRFTASSFCKPSVYKTGSLNLLRRGEGIARAAAPFGIANEDAVIEQSENVPMSGVLGARGKTGVLGSRELAFEAVEHAVDHKPLSVIELHTFYMLPKPCFIEHGA